MTTIEVVQNETSKDINYNYCKLECLYQVQLQDAEGVLICSLSRLYTCSLI